MSADRQQQMAQAEEILGDRLSQAGFVKGLFFGRHLSQRLLPYPQSQHESVANDLAQQLRSYCETSIDPVAIDRNAEIPEEVIRGLGKLGVLGACLPQSAGGLGLSQTQYCRLLEVLGGHCASTALFVNAHHSIGPRSIVLFGTPQQQAQWLPKLASGEWISAFALTEPNAGSDAANVQTTATPSADGSGFVINGQKRWITNGGIAQALTVMARTPTPDGKDSKITAFLVTPDMPGFQIVEKRMPKMGCRGTATSRLAFENMFVPRENVLGPLGKGLKVALTVLDFGRTTFGATCTGAAKYCVRRAVQHCQTRVQFDQPIGDFELVKEKLAWMQAGQFAMEACTYQTAALMDSGDGDFMLETAMLKVFATETLWRILNDTFQLHGGLAYFNDQPFERMVRDARINTIGEGANDVLRAFTALVGMRDVGLELVGVLNAFYSPLGNLSKLGRFAGRKFEAWLVAPPVAVRSSELDGDASRLGHLIGHFGGQVERLLATYQEDIVDRQYQLGRIADAATDLYVSACVINRLDSLLLQQHNGDEAGLRMDLATGRHFLRLADRRVRRSLADLWNNDDAATTELANRMLKARG
jgi:alkylation response protein AidB-like acyl-CoA dehydrogenase